MRGYFYNGGMTFQSPERFLNDPHRIFLGVSIHSQGKTLKSPEGL